MILLEHTTDELRLKIYNNIQPICEFLPDDYRDWRSIPLIVSHQLPLLIPDCIIQMQPLLLTNSYVQCIRRSFYRHLLRIVPGSVYHLTSSHRLSVTNQKITTESSNSILLY